MYGGTGRWRLSAVAWTMPLLVVVTGCQQHGTASDRPAGSARETPGGVGDARTEIDASAYETWEPTYGDVRPATAAEIEALRQRITDLNATAYTAEVPLMGLEISSDPEHVRVRFGEGGTGGFDLHLDPTATSEAILGGFVICSADDGSCIDVGEDGPKNGGPHVFSNGIDTIVFLASSIVGAQLEGPDDLAETESASITTVDSPSGVLDCLLTGSTPERRERLAGKPIDLMADPFSRVGGPEPLSTVCVDERGLVVVTLPSLMSGVVAYGELAAGVPDDFDQHASPVPYGETPTATPTPRPTPTPGTESDEVQEVLMAAGPIRAGESLADVQASGRIFLGTVMGRQLSPGAVSSTSGVDGVALRDIAEGEQITEVSFG